MSAGASSGKVELAETISYLCSDPRHSKHVSSTSLSTTMSKKAAMEPEIPILSIISHWENARLVLLAIDTTFALLLTVMLDGTCSKLSRCHL